MHGSGGCSWIMDPCCGRFSLLSVIFVQRRGSAGSGIMTASGDFAGGGAAGEETWSCGYTSGRDAAKSPYDGRLHDHGTKVTKAFGAKLEALACFDFHLSSSFCDQLFSTFLLFIASQPVSFVLESEKSSRLRHPLLCRVPELQVSRSCLL